MQVRCEVPFDIHAQNFLSKMPTINNWGHQHIKVMRSTVKCYLLPAFGSKSVARIGKAEFRALDKLFKAKGLSEARQKNIVRVANQILDAGDLTSLEPAMAANVSCSRQEADESAWQRNFAEFCQQWSENGKTNNFSRPIAAWVWKERRKYRGGQMPDNHRGQLEEVGFPFSVPPSHVAIGRTNKECAELLIKLHKEHGHFAPTHAQGGSALQKWTGRMRLSEGRVGQLSDRPGTAKHAERLLREYCPTFTWEQTKRSHFHEEQGCQWNGQVHSTRGPCIPADIARLIARADQCVKYRVPKVQPESLNAPYELHKFIEVARVLNQATRLLDGNGFECGWVKRFNVDDGALVVTWGDADGCMQSQPVTDVGVDNVFEDDFVEGYYRLSLGIAGRAHSLEVDWLLGEQCGLPAVVREVLKDQIEHDDYAGELGWAIALQSHRVKHFVPNLRKLVAKTMNAQGPLFARWDCHRPLYAYLEHCRRKARRGTLGRFEFAMLKASEVYVGGAQPMRAHDWVLLA